MFPTIIVVPTETVVVTALVVVFTEIGIGVICIEELGELGFALILGLVGEGNGRIEGEVEEVGEAESTEEEDDTKVGRVEEDVEIEVKVTRVLTRDEGDASDVTVAVAVDAATVVVLVELAVTVVAKEVEVVVPVVVAVVVAAVLDGLVSGWGGAGGVVAVTVVVDWTVEVTVGKTVVLDGFTPPPLHVKPIELKKLTSAPCAIKGLPGASVYKKAFVDAATPLLTEQDPSTGIVRVTEYCEIIL